MQSIRKSMVAFSMVDRPSGSIDWREAPRCLLLGSGCFQNAPGDRVARARGIGTLKINGREKEFNIKKCNFI
ncbi:MAG: hypothetical protein DMG36_23950 [Acidobacteria bacterium]|nr:MAG: hypothetical protein DMG36_23950 [Acidobacteriota bacterium]